MTYLLDTQIVIWLLSNPERLRTFIQSALKNPVNRSLISHVCLYEIAIKQKIGKLPEVSVSILELINQLKEDGFDFLPITETHLTAYERIPLVNDHRDPFDRLLIATAHVEGAALISADEKFKGYSAGISTLIENHS